MNILGILIAALLQQQGPASIEGVVVRAGTSQPVARVIVQLRGTSRSESLAMATGADGRFEFRNIAPGSYRLTVARSGYLDSAYGRLGQIGAGGVLVVGAGQTLRNIRLAMIASAAISGRVYDSNGEPAANVAVQALGYSYADGRKTLTAVKTDNTDDRGEYRLFGLRPGPYFISGTLPGEAGAPVYYPGTADVQAAAAVEVRPGADIGAVDFTLTRVTGRKVRGIVVDSITGRPAASAGVALVPRRPSGAGLSNGRPSTDGTFEIQNVAPGLYFLVATFWHNAGGALTMMGGRIPLEVGGSDVDGLTMVLSPALNIAGEVNLEGRNDTAVDARHPTVSLKNEIQSFPGLPADALAHFSASRQFTIDNVIEGDYRVLVGELPQGTYVQSIRYGPVDVLNGSLHIDPRTSQRLDVVLSVNAAVLDGIVVDEDGRPVANTPVALVPDAARRQRVDLFRSAWTDEFGRFRLQAIPPGDYSLFAIEGLDESVWRDPEFLERNEAAGKTIRMSSGGHESIKLTSH